MSTLSLTGYTSYYLNTFIKSLNLLEIILFDKTKRDKIK